MMHLLAKRWLPLALATSAALALWALAAEHGYAWETIWLPAAVAGAAWPSNRTLTRLHTLTRLQVRARARIPHSWGSCVGRATDRRLCKVPAVTVYRLVAHQEVSNASGPAPRWSALFSWSQVFTISIWISTTTHRTHSTRCRQIYARKCRTSGSSSKRSQLQASRCLVAIKACRSPDAVVPTPRCCRTRSRFFRGPLVRLYGHDPEMLRREVRRVVLHEVAHHFGISDDRSVEP